MSCPSNESPTLRTKLNEANNNGLIRLLDKQQKAKTTNTRALSWHVGVESQATKSRRMFCSVTMVPIILEKVCGLWDGSDLEDSPDKLWVKQDYEDFLLKEMLWY